MRVSLCVGEAYPRTRHSDLRPFHAGARASRRSLVTRPAGRGVDDPFSKGRVDTCSRAAGSSACPPIRRRAGHRYDAGPPNSPGPGASLRASSPHRGLGELLPGRERGCRQGWDETWGLESCLVGVQERRNGWVNVAFERVRPGRRPVRSVWAGPPPSYPPRMDAGVAEAPRRRRSARA